VKDETRNKLKEFDAELLNDSGSYDPRTDIDREKHRNDAIGAIDKFVRRVTKI
jgi:hypothetical protein